MTTVPTHIARTVTEQNFATFGLGEIAFVRQVEINGHPAFAIIGADGAAITAYPSADAARGAIIQEDMEPLSLH